MFMERSLLFKETEFRSQNPKQGITAVRNIL